jgi:hypothetical protein
MHTKTVPGVGKVKQKPDRIVGLSETSIIKELLGHPYVHGEYEGLHRPSLKKIVKTSINPDVGGAQLLFPFLVLEAKVEKGKEGFEHAEVQSALPIMEALKLQYDLMKVPGNTVEVPGGPLVWFLANRGEHWRVYAAYVVEDNERPTYVSLCERFGTFADSTSG